MQMNYHDIDWLACFKELSLRANKEKAGSEESRQAWDEKAPSFARKPKRTGYIARLVELMDLGEGETVFDFGCGSGTLAVPLAKAGHAVFAADFSAGMLDELRRAAESAGVPISPAGAAMPEAGTIALRERSWQESWSDLPRADVVVSSRSLITEDLADAIGKMEAHAEKRVVLTIGAGNLPYRDRRILKAMGRDCSRANDPVELACVMSYLFEIGRFPELRYIVVAEPWNRRTREGLEEAVRRSHTPQNEAEERALASFLDEHIVRNDAEGRYELDYPRENRWAYIEWKVPERV